MGKGLLRVCLGCLFIASSIAAASETYFKFDIASRDQIKVITRIVSIDKVDQKTVYAYANEDELSKFDKLNLPYQILPNPGDLANPRMEGSPPRGGSNWDFYPTYDAYETLMAQFQTKYPQLSKLFELGRTVQGRKLFALKITGNVEEEISGKPEFFYSSTMHGDETTGYVLMLRLADYLLSNYGKDSKVTDLVNNVEIWITPLANPDGTYRRGNATVQGAQRYNGNSVDLNRNYPDPEGGQHPDGNDWQPETAAFMTFADQHHFVMGANFHGGAEVVNYPWDTWSKRHADNDWYMQVANEYVGSVHSLAPKYMVDLNNGVTNGFDWYEVKGGRQDYMNYEKNCREMTIELSGTKLANASDRKSVV
jgi:hypothetical protein